MAFENREFSFLCSNFAPPNFNPLYAKITKWSNTLKQFVGNLPTNCLSVFDHFVGLALKGLNTGFTVILQEEYIAVKTN